MSNEDRILLRKIIDSLNALDYINPDAIPNIDLYIDQVTTFLDEQLKPSKRSPEDKAITKTMINNYVKSHLLPAPEKKKYTKEHVLTLIFIYYLKNFLSIGDVEEILNPLTDNFFANSSTPSLGEIYDEIFALQKDAGDYITKDVIRKFQASRKTFEDAPEEATDMLHNFALISYLSFEVYIKKKIVETIIDQTFRTSEEDEGKDKDK